ncbi:nitrate ABC transporter permease [Polynucleobacter yangtzensis]|uniref:nitrate ABC transporter permease n=1 Tax=Polynucleobacter yangtzensis TaxID=1743159 RepID=UPI00082AF6BC|nr:nitrate ABC transporter permease [Polynucleobacter yangtzensis]
MKTASIKVKGAILSVVILLMCLFIWHMATTQKVTPPPGVSTASSEYSSLMGQGGSEPVQKTGFPTLTQMGETIYKQLSHPFYDNGPNDKGIGIQLAYSLGRVALGFLLAMIVAIPFGFWIGMSPLAYEAFNPFIQILKPISPLAWMPIALYTIKDSAISGIFVIFICSVWPMLLNTAFGVANVRKELLNVAKTLEVSPLRKAFLVILPAAAPTILTGMRISMGIAWLVIVAAEMLVGGTGIGYFLWNEWNNLSLSSVIFAILLIGIVGMLLDTAFGKLQKAVSYAD